jgi:hypothetical protein
MVRSNPGLWSNIERVRLSETELARRLKLLNAQVKRLSNEAAGLGLEWEAAVAREEDARRADDTGAMQRQGERREMIHKARCARLADLAKTLRATYRCAAADLLIDETTAGTGLTDEERMICCWVSAPDEWLSW